MDYQYINLQNNKVDSNDLITLEDLLTEGEISRDEYIDYQLILNSSAREVKVKTKDVKVQTNDMDFQYVTEIQNYSSGFSIRYMDLFRRHKSALRVIASLPISDNRRFKMMVCFFLKDLKVVLAQVDAITLQYCQMRLVPGAPLWQRVELQKKVEIACKQVITSCTTLERMVDNETYTPNHKMMKLLKEANINIENVDPGHLYNYKTLICECKKNSIKFLSLIQSHTSEYVFSNQF